MHRLKEAGLKLEKSKCEFFKPEVTYFGYTISKDGVRKCKKTVDAILNAPTPKNINEVRSFCGLAHYYGKFVHNWLAHLPLVLSCDASNSCTGAVLSYRGEHQNLKPIAFASRTLTPAEINYSTIRKEGLAIVFGVKKFYQFLIGRHFFLQTDQSHCCQFSNRATAYR